ncbi:MAG: CapA family protein [Clostridia bacterium]|nr:CapA family protein [Clostridia bacterium]
MKRKILAAALSLITLSSCGGEAPEQNTVKPTAEEPEIKRVSFVGCGDNIVYKGTVMDAAERSTGERTYNFKPQYDNVKEKIESADIAFINQETVMDSSRELSYYPMFNSPTDMAYDLSEVGYDVVNVATNHMLDKGSDGLSNNIEFLKTMPYMVIGGYENNADFMTPRVMEKNGIKIAFASFTYGTNGMSKSASSDLKIPYINDDDIKRQLTMCKENADFVIVSVHWGVEGSMTPSEEQKKTARLMADMGADVIVGHHPHVIQPVEWIERADGGRTLCVYSLGNFAAMQAYDYNMLGGMIEFDIVKKDEDKPYLENVYFTPTVYHFGSNFRNTKVYYLSEYTPELANKHGVKTRYARHLSIETFNSYVDKTIDAEFLR